MMWPFGDVAPFSQDIVYADPAWLFQLRSEEGEAKSAQAQYDCMPLEEMMKLPVADLARGDALCFMWTTWPMVAIDAPTRLMRSWGFNPITGGAWFKRTKHDKAAFGTGYVFRSACEPFLVGTLGSPLTAKNVRNVLETLEEDNAIYAKTREHSRKPDETYDLLERLCPRALKGIELFARQRYTGGKIEWTTALSNEADKFQVDTKDSGNA